VASGPEVAADDERWGLVSRLLQLGGDRITQQDIRNFAVHYGLATPDLVLVQYPKQLLDGILRQWDVSIHAPVKARRWYNNKMTGGGKYQMFREPSA